MPCRAVRTLAALAALCVYESTALAQQPTRSVWDGVYTAAQAERGGAQYGMHCASCHGPTLGGIEMAPALVGSQFLGDFGGATAGELMDRIHNTMPVKDPGSISLRIDADIMAYIFQANQFPAGERELPSISQALQLIRIDPVKPEK